MLNPSVYNKTVNSQNREMINLKKHAVHANGMLRWCQVKGAIYSSVSLIVKR